MPDPMNVSQFEYLARTGVLKPVPKLHVVHAAAAETVIPIDTAASRKALPTIAAARHRPAAPAPKPSFLTRLLRWFSLSFAVGCVLAIVQQIGRICGLVGFVIAIVITTNAPADIWTSPSRPHTHDLVGHSGDESPKTENDLASAWALPDTAKSAPRLQEPASAPLQQTASGTRLTNAALPVPFENRQAGLLDQTFQDTAFVLLATAVVIIATLQATHAASAARRSVNASRHIRGARGSASFLFTDLSENTDARNERILATDDQPVAPRQIKSRPRPQSPAVGSTTVTREHGVRNTRSQRGYWASAVRSLKGNVREENQDRGRLLRVNGCEVLIVCDGCGGVPGGGVASELASHAAERAITSVLNSAMLNDGPPGGALKFRALEQAFIAAETSLLAEARARGICDAAPQIKALQTTMMVVIADEATLSIAYIGDGMLQLFDPPFGTRDLLKPHRPEGFSNRLTGCVGPAIKGRPEYITTRRTTRGILIAATDGISDRVDEARISRWLISRIIEEQGRTDHALELLLSECASQKTDGNFHFDDNMTLGVLLGVECTAHSLASALADSGPVQAPHHMDQSKSPASESTNCRLAAPDSTDTDKPSPVNHEQGGSSVRSRVAL